MKSITITPAYVFFKADSTGKRIKPGERVELAPVTVQNIENLEDINIVGVSAVCAAYNGVVNTAAKADAKKLAEKAALRASL